MCKQTVATSEFILNNVSVQRMNALNQFLKEILLLSSVPK